MWKKVYISQSGREKIHINKNKVIFEHRGRIIMKVFTNEFESVIYSKTLMFALRKMDPR